MITQKIEGTPIKLGGETFIIPPLCLASLENHGEEIAASKLLSNDPAAMMSKAGIGLVIDLAFESLQQNYPEMTRDSVAKMLNLANMQEVFEAIMTTSIPKPEPGEKPSAGE